MNAHYDTDADALYIRLASAEITASEEVSPGVILDFDAAGHLVAVEILNARQRLPAGTDLPVAAA